MKKLSLKSKILLGAFLVAGLGAGAQEVAFQIANAQEQVYQWNGSGPLNSGSFTGTVANARLHYGCVTGPNDCAKGEAEGQPDVIIKKP